MDKMLEQSPISCYGRLTDKSAIATRNTTQRSFLDDGYRLYDFISDGILHTKEVNRKVNFSWLTTVNVNGKKNYYYPGEVFRNMAIEKFGNLSSKKPHLKIVK